MVGLALFPTRSGIASPRRRAVLTSFSTAGSSYSTAVGIYTGSRGSLTQVSCFSEGAGLIAEAGVTYYIRVADYFGQGGGSLVFSARRGVTVDALTIDGTGLLDRASGSVTVSGSVTCSEPATVVLTIAIEQRRGQRVAEAEVPCSDTRSTWSVSVPPFIGPFVPGRAQVSAQAGLCSLLVCDIEEASADSHMCVTITKRLGAGQEARSARGPSMVGCTGGGTPRSKGRAAHLALTQPATPVLTRDCRSLQGSAGYCDSKMGGAGLEPATSCL